MLPLVTVIIPTYQYANFITLAIESVLEQAYPTKNIEIIVVDDGSTDNTSEIVGKYGSKVQYIYQDNAGKAAATRRAINCSQGKYILNLDADDYFYPDKIEQVVKIFESDQDIVHVAHPAKYIFSDEEQSLVEDIPSHVINKKHEGIELLLYFYRRNMLYGGGSTFGARTSVLKKINIPDSIDMYIDEYLVFSVLSQGCTYYLNDPYSVWRIHSSNYSKANKQTDRYLRNIKSRKQLTKIVIHSDIPGELKNLFLLKDIVSDLSHKESMNSKSFRDVVDLWIYFFTTFNVLDFNSIRLLRVYNIFNRSLPTFLYNTLKKLKIYMN